MGKARQRRLFCVSRTVVVMGNPVWQCGPLLEVAVLNVADTVTQPDFGLYCLQLHHSFNAKVL